MKFCSTPRRASRRSSASRASSTSTSPTCAPSCRPADRRSWAPASAAARTARWKRRSRRSVRPLLDNVSIAGATGVLVNITGGADLTLGEVHQINEIIHDAVGDDAEIIFGAVHEPAMQGEIRVTVIATGFDRALARCGAIAGIRTSASRQRCPRDRRSFRSRASRPARVIGTAAPRPEAPRQPRPAVVSRQGSQDLSDMEIPTFIRRQMD